MPDVLLFGATGYTGRLTAHALARRGTHFVVCGRDRRKLEELASATGGPEIRVASVDDLDSLVDALKGVRVMITCVGPFIELGDTAAEAAVRAGVHYIDSTGESAFIRRLLSDYDERARAAGIAMAPAMGFDEVPADNAATLAVEGMKDAELVMTYAVPTTPSRGTMVTVLRIVSEEGMWVADGRPTPIRPAHRTRWAPMPPPLGPKKAMSFPLAEGVLAPMHLDLKTFEAYVTTSPLMTSAARFGIPGLRLVRSTALGSKALDRALSVLPDGPEGKARGARFTILAEARSGRAWRNVAITGSDIYGLTAEFLSAGAGRMLDPGYEKVGVVAPVEAVGLDTWQKVFADTDVDVDVYQQA